MEPQPNNDRNPSTPVPRWLTVGAWVTPRYGMVPLRVEKIYSDRIVFAKNDSGETFLGHPSQLRPISFRYPTLQEAYSWLGKVMDKGKPKKTTDDCYTPPAVYDAVLAWARAEFAIPESAPILRPFRPDCDNLTKLIHDVIAELGIGFADDAQAAHGLDSEAELWAVGDYGAPVEVEP